MTCCYFLLISFLEPLKTIYDFLSLNNNFKVQNIKWVKSRLCNDFLK